MPVTIGSDRDAPKKSHIGMAIQESPNFENTKVAFSAKSTFELKKAEWLFSMIGRSWITGLAKSITNFSLKMGLPIDPLLKYTVFGHFCGGETVEQCKGTVENMYQHGGVSSILDYSVEGKQGESFFEGTLQTLLEVCAHAKANPAVPFLVFKPSGMGRFEIYQKVSERRGLDQAEMLEWERISQRFDTICGAVAATDSLKIMIDAEESWIQKAIDGLVESMMLKYNGKRTVVFNTVQMYRNDRLSYLHNVHSFGRDHNVRIGVKLVRGAYMEKERERARTNGYESPICSDKAATDANFDSGLKFCLLNLEVFDVFVGTHNEGSCLQFSQKLNEEGMAKNDHRIWFGQLYGMSDHISFNLAKEGYNTAKYVPFGPVKEVVPYLFRRAEENTSVGSQTSRELSFIKKELQRRKKERELSKI